VNNTVFSDTQIMPKTTVVIVNYKNALDTFQCINSISETVNAPLTVVVDNSPNDLELRFHLLDFKNVKLICAPENLGFSQGNNLGIEWALSNTSSSYIFILNNDAVVDSKTIEILEETLELHPEAGIAAPRVVFMDNPETLWYGVGEVSWARGGGMVPGYMGPSDSLLALQAREVTFASGCAMLVRREVFQKLKGFHPDFFMYEEDLEFSLRTQNLGWFIYYEPRALVKHKVQASSSKDDGFIGMLSPLNKNLSFYTYHLIRNRLINMRLHAKGAHRITFFFGFSLFVLKTSLNYFIHKRWDGILSIIKAWQAYLLYIKSIEKVNQ
jgi:GT2 family glycosyltransferase